MGNVLHAGWQIFLIDNRNQRQIIPYLVTKKKVVPGVKDSVEEGDDTPQYG